MNHHYARLVSLSFLLIGFGCLPNRDALLTRSSMKDLKVDEGFNFVSTRDIQLNVQVQNPLFTQERYRINVYDQQPDTGNLLATGITDTDQKLSLSFRVAAPLTDLYVEKVNPFGAREVTKVSAHTYAVVDFNSSTPTLQLRRAAQEVPDCQTGTTKVLENYNGWVNVEKGEVISLMGSFSGGLNMHGGTVRICGKASLDAISMDGPDTKVYFLAGSSVAINNLNMNAGTAQVYNYTTDLTIRNGMSLGGNFENNGTMSVNGDLNLNNNGANTFLNNGSLTVSSNLNNNRSLENTGSLVVKGAYQANGGSTTLNHCKLMVGDQLIINAPFTNAAYVSVAHQLTINGGSSLTLKDGALISARDGMINGSIVATGSGKSTVKIAGQTTFNGGSSLSGSLNYCDANGVEVNNSQVARSFFNCENFIPSSSCNPEGFGKPVIVDTDGDGVADSQDEFPSDAAKATTSNYPSTTGWATYGFEDNWPQIGDYDFNDLVLDFRVTRVLNAKNQITEMRVNILVQALGAGYVNGLGFQLDQLTPEEISSVSGSVLTKGLVTLNANKTEAGQSKAVILAYDTPEPLIHRTSGSFFNVIKTDPAGEPGKQTLVITFKTPIDPSRITQAGINPFIFVSGTRGREVHLPNYRPTDQANPDLLSHQDDTSLPNRGRWYKSANNLPWVIEIPSQFAYPVEHSSLMDAYNYFGSWAKSGGSQYLDWFQRKPGYQQSTKIYSH